MLNGTLLGAINQQTILMIGLLAMVFLLPYFTVTRPQKKQQQQRTVMLNSLKKGDEVMTVGGFYGVVKSVKDDRFVLEMSPDKVKLELRKESILNKVEKPGETPELEYDYVIEDEAEKEKDEAK